MTRRAFGALTLIALLALSGCMRTVRARDTHYAGFLDDYSRLRRGERYDALFRWRKPGIDWAAYDKLLLEPVRIWEDPGVAPDLTDPDAEALLGYFYNRLYISLCPHYLMIETPDDGAARLEVVVTGIEPRRTFFDTLSTLSPFGMATTAATGAVTGKAPFTGELALEFRISDAGSGEVLSEGADRRIGGKWIPKGLDKWADAYAAIDAWAENLSYRLCVLRADADCTPPVNP